MYFVLYDVLCVAGAGCGSPATCEALHLFRGRAVHPLWQSRVDALSSGPRLKFVEEHSVQSPANLELLLVRGAIGVKEDDKPNFCVCQNTEAPRQTHCNSPLNIQNTHAFVAR